MHGQNHISSELDATLLSSPFKVQTNWHVITGAACCGKTTLIELLAARGLQTAYETARVYIDCQTARGRPIEDIIGDPATELAIEGLQSRLENDLHPSNTVFMDRSLVDCLTFRRLHGKDINEFLPRCFHHQYASVFILDRLPYQLDGARVDDDTYKGVLDHWLFHDYSALGYDVVRVPVVPPQERLEIILNHLSAKGLI